MGRPEDCHCPCGYEPVLRREPITVIITEQPKNATVYDDIAIFSISSTIDQLPSYYYQWQKKRFFEDKFVDIPLARGSTLLISNPSLDDNGSKYRVYIGHYGKEQPVYSQEATLSIVKDISEPIITITNDLKNIDLGFLDSTELSIQAKVDIDTKLLYQWQVRRNGIGAFEDITNATDNKLNLKSLSYEKDNLNEYRVKIKTLYSHSNTFSNVARITLTKIPKIIIATQPQDTNSDQGIASFYVEASTDDGTPVNYNWQRKRPSDSQFINIPSANSNFLSVNNLNNLQDDESLYRATLYIANLNRFKYSQYATLKVPKSIITVINPNTFFPMAVSGIIDLSVSATITSGDEILYQWQRRSNEFDNVFINISGATSPSLRLTGLEYDTDDNNVYRVSLSAKYSKNVNTSQFFNINVPYAPKINIIDDTQLISSISGNIGQDRSFTLFSTAELEFNEVTKVSGELFGIWQKYDTISNNWNDIIGESGDYFSINNAKYLDYNGQSFRRYYTSDQGSTPKYSSSFTIYLDKPTIVIDQQPPISFTAISGVAEVSISASINFNEVLSYQWQKFNTQLSQYIDIEDTNNNKLVLSNLTYLNNNLDRYRVKISGSDGANSVISNFSTLSIDRPVISIQRQPTNQVASAHSAAFVVNASITNTSAPLSFQWQKKDTLTNTYSNIQNENRDFLLLSNLLSNKNNNEIYRVGILGVDGASSLVSNDAVLSVFPPIISIQQNLNSVVSKDSTAVFAIVASSTYEGIVNYRWKRKKENENSFTYLDGLNPLQPFLSLSGLNFFKDNNSIYQAELNTIDPNTPTVTSSSGTLLIPLIGAISNLFNDFVYNSNITTLRLSNLYLDSIVNKDVSSVSLSNLYLDSIVNKDVSSVSLSNLYLDSIVNKDVTFVALSNLYLDSIVNKDVTFVSLSNLSLDSTNEIDILRIPFSGKSIINDGFIQDKIYLNITPNTLLEGSEKLGYNIELTNINQSTKYNITYTPDNFTTGGSIVTELDSGFFLMEPSNYNIRIRTINYNDPINYANDYSNSVLCNYLRPPTPVRLLNVSLPSGNDGRHNLNISWQTPSFDGNSTVYYEILESGYNSSSYETILSSGSYNNTTFTASGLRPGTSYTYKVFAKNSYGYSTESLYTESTTSLLLLEASFTSDSSLEYIENKVHFDYLTMNLPYIMKIENAIFGLYYDLFYY